MEAQEADTDNVSREDFGKMLYGCEHYRRRCKIRAPCCDKIFTCRHCHNEATNALSNPKERHEIVRHDVKQVVCAVCGTKQQVASTCSNCGVKFGEYFCDICKFYDDDQVGGRENFFHCPKCGSCYGVSLHNNHLCVEDSMKGHCPICYEFLFDSTKQTTILKCGHTMHMECYDEMFRQHQYRCPICSKSVLDMSSAWERLDQEVERHLLLLASAGLFTDASWTDTQIAGGEGLVRDHHAIDATAMPEEYRREVQILCNDCNNRSTASFHIIGHKCRHCSSYNTRVITSEESRER
ncbi:hypothetical protein OROMI_015698 [Orobanche minor]